MPRSAWQLRQDHIARSKIASRSPSKDDEFRM
jgi:hypothetical protein